MKYPETAAEMLEMNGYTQPADREIAALRMEMTRYRDLIDVADRYVEGLRSELAHIRSQPHIPISDHRLALDRLDLALGQVDALTREVADLRDSRWRQLAEQRLALMANAARHMGRDTFGHGDERNDMLALFCHVAEHAEKPAHVQAWHTGHEAWEAGRR